MLEKFVNLLSNINCESPWYFSEISGLDAAMERKIVMSENVLLEATRPKITIKCLPDAYDDRIGTLLDMYRAIVWDWKSKREIVPSNLRKFDMGILIFETPNSPFHIRKGQSPTEGDRFSYAYGPTDLATSSYKYIEFHNCEIDYNSTKALYSALNNKEGFSPEYNIDIHFDDCYESRYNEFDVNRFGDDFLLIVQGEESEDGSPIGVNFQTASEYIDNLKEKPAYNTWDPRNEEEEKIKNQQKKIYEFDNEEEQDKIISWTEEESKSMHEDSNSPDSNIKIPGISKNVLPQHKGSKTYDYGLLGNAINQLVSVGLDKVNSLFKKAVLGNLYTFSLTKMGDQLKQLASGDILGTARNVQNYIKDSKNRKAGNEPHQAGDLFPETGYEMGSPSGSLYGEAKPIPQHKQSDMFVKKKIKPSVKYIGNMFQGNTIANNL
jgi:hypothetical protein